MNGIGAYLREQRNICGLSLGDVFAKCGITNSRLSRFETGKGKPFSPNDLKKLAKLYGICVIELYVMAGYLDDSDLSSYQYIFNDAHLLTDEEKQIIQTQINLYTRGRQESSHDI